MKATIRVPMRESFAYIEFEAEVEEGSAGAGKALELYKEAQALSKELLGNIKKDDNDF